MQFETALSPSQQVEPFEAPIVLVKCQRGNDVWFPERWASQATEAQTVLDIVSGELTDVAEVFELGRAIPITEDIARAVADHYARDREPVPYRVQGWLHEHHPAGVMATRGLNLSEAA